MGGLECLILYGWLFSSAVGGGRRSPASVCVWVCMCERERRLVNVSVCVRACVTRSVCQCVQQTCV